MRYSIVFFALTISLFTACSSSSKREQSFDTYHSQEQNDPFENRNTGSTRTSFRSRQPTPRQSHAPLTRSQVLAIANGNTPDVAISTLDKSPLAFQLTDENLAYLQQQNINRNVLDYLKLRSVINWKSLNNPPQQRQLERLPEPTQKQQYASSSASARFNADLNSRETYREFSNDDIISSANQPVGQLAEVESAAVTTPNPDTNRFSYVAPPSTAQSDDSRRSSVIIYPAPTIGFGYSYPYRRYYYPGYGFGYGYYYSRPRYRPRRYVRPRVTIAPRVSINLGSKRRSRRYYSQPTRRIVRQPRVRSTNRGFSGSRRVVRSSRGRRRR